GIDLHLLEDGIAIGHLRGPLFVAAGVRELNGQVQSYPAFTFRADVAIDVLAGVKIGLLLVRGLNRNSQADAELAGLVSREKQLVDAGALLIITRLSDPELQLVLSPSLRSGAFHLLDQAIGCGHLVGCGADDKAVIHGQLLYALHFNDSAE